MRREGEDQFDRETMLADLCDTLEKIVSALGYEIALVKIIEK